MKNLFKFSLGLFLTIFCISPLFSQSFSKTYNPNLPIAYTAMMGIPQFSAKELFVAKNLKGKSAENGYIGSIESTSNTNGVFSGSLLIKIENINVIRFTFNLQSDTDGDFNYITYVSIKNLLTAATSETKWRNGDMGTAARLVGQLFEIIGMVYDKNNLFGPEYAAAQAKIMQEAAERKAREEKEAEERKIREEKIASERQISSNLSQRFKELPFIQSGRIISDTINENEFSIFMKLNREYISVIFEYRDNSYISRDISDIDDLVKKVINVLNGQQKIEYYSEFDPGKVEQVKMDIQKEEERKKQAAIEEAKRSELAEKQRREREAELNKNEQARATLERIEPLLPRIYNHKFTDQEIDSFVQAYKAFKSLQPPYSNYEVQSYYNFLAREIDDLKRGMLSKMSSKQKKKYQAEFN